MAAATSGCPDFWIPEVTPAARNPAGGVMLIVSPPLASWAPGGPAFPRRSFLAPQSRRRRAPLARGSWRDPAGGEAGRLPQAEHEVGVLDCPPGGALSQCVEVRPRGRPSRPAA